MQDGDEEPRPEGRRDGHQRNPGSGQDVVGGGPFSTDLLLDRNLNLQGLGQWHERQEKPVPNEGVGEPIVCLKIKLNSKMIFKFCEKSHFIEGI